jgi:hypothetical protein
MYHKGIPVLHHHKIIEIKRGISYILPARATKLLSITIITRLLTFNDSWI